MGTYKEIYGNLIHMALEDEFDVITHGCNCFCTMGSGIAPLMAKAFGCDKFTLENEIYKGDYNKMGQIDFEPFTFTANGIRKSNPNDIFVGDVSLYVVNSYSQYYYGSHPSNSGTPLDYDALRMCFRKINHTFPDKKIGLPLIGCGLAKGDWNIVSQMIKEELKDMDVVIVKLP